MLNVAGGILLAIAVLVAGLFLVRHLKVVGVLFCAAALVAVIAAMVAGSSTGP